MVVVWRNVAYKLLKCCEGEEGDDGDSKQVYTYFGNGLIDVDSRKDVPFAAKIKTFSNL